MATNDIRLILELYSRPSYSSKCTSKEESYPMNKFCKDSMSLSTIASLDSYNFFRVIRYSRSYMFLHILGRIFFYYVGIELYPCIKFQLSRFMGSTSSILMISKWVNLFWWSVSIELVKFCFRITSEMYNIQDLNFEVRLGGGTAMPPDRKLKAIYIFIGIPLIHTSLSVRNDCHSHQEWMACIRKIFNYTWVHTNTTLEASRGTG